MDVCKYSGEICHGFLQRLISKGNSSYESGRAQYHLKALQAIFQGPFSKKEVGHVISEQENYHCISSVLSTIENEMNGRYDHIYLSACLTKFSKLLNEIRFEEYTSSWHYFGQHTSWYHSYHPYEHRKRIKTNSAGRIEQKVSILLEMHWHVFILNQLMRYKMLDIYHFADDHSHSSSLTLRYETWVIDIDNVDDDLFGATGTVQSCYRWLVSPTELYYVAAVHYRQMVGELTHFALLQYHGAERTLFRTFYASVLSVESSSLYSYIEVGDVTAQVDYFDWSGTSVELKCFTFQSFVNDIINANLTSVWINNLFLLQQ
jgi:hypothetical protein